LRAGLELRKAQCHCIVHVIDPSVDSVDTSVDSADTSVDLVDISADLTDLCAKLGDSIENSPSLSKKRGGCEIFSTCGQQDLEQDREQGLEQH